MDEKELANIEARMNAARPGPFIVKNENEGTEYFAFWVINADTEEEPDESGEWFAELHVGDFPTAAFFAAARSDVPALVAEVKWLQAAIARLEEVKEWALNELASGPSCPGTMRPAVPGCRGDGGCLECWQEVAESAAGVPMTEKQLPKVKRLEKMVDYLAQAAANGGFGGLRRSPESWKQEAEQAALHDGQPG
jgi:hypothetical protein